MVGCLHADWRRLLSRLFRRGVGIRIAEYVREAERDESFIGVSQFVEFRDGTREHLRSTPPARQQRENSGLIRLCQGERGERDEGRTGRLLPGPICKSVPGCWILINVLVTRKRAGDAII